LTIVFIGGQWSEKNSKWSAVNGRWSEKQPMVGGQWSETIVKQPPISPTRKL
jgi:hypothetical protein